MMSGVAALLIVALAAFSGCGRDDRGETTVTPQENEAAATETAEWSYSGPDGPENWGELDPAYAKCGSGNRQSPINITGSSRVASSGISVEYRPETLILENNGHAMEARIDQSESSITVDGSEYDLEQFHFHTPAEERVEGQTYDASIHLVHLDESGNAAVIGLLVETGVGNPLIGELTAQMPLEEGEEAEIEGDLNPMDLLEGGGPVFRYIGSLTTPPCTEGVRWIVFERPVTMSAEQLQTFKDAYADNSRPIQPREQRPIRISPPPA